jgi:hypothetical protein
MESAMADTSAVELQPDKNRLILWLGYLGLIPFLVPLVEMTDELASGVGVHGASLFGFYAPYVFIAYSAIILSFLAGILWAKSRDFSHKKIARPMIIFSNLLALSAWASLLLINISSILMVFAVALLLCGYGSLLLAERSLDHDAKDSQYWRMRLVLTMLVICAHSLVLVYLIREL